MLLNNPTVIKYDFIHGTRLRNREYARSMRSSNLMKGKDAYLARGFYFARSYDHIQATDVKPSWPTPWTMNFRRSVDALCTSISWLTMSGRETYCRSRPVDFNADFMFARWTRISDFRKARQISVSRARRTSFAAVGGKGRERERERERERAKYIRNSESRIWNVEKCWRVCIFHITNTESANGNFLLCFF